MTDLADAEARSPDPDRVRHDLLRRGGGGNRQDDRSGRPHRRADPQRRRHARPDRRGHLHREGGRRDEASPPQRDREGANGSDARGTRSAGPRARGTGACSYRHDPRLLRRPSPRAAGRGRDRSALRSCFARTRPRRSRTKLSSAGSRRILADPPEGVRGASSGADRAGNPPREQLRGAMHSLREHRDFPEPWRRDPFDRNGAIDTLMDELAQLGALAAASSWPDDYLARNLAEIARFVEETTRLEAVRGRDYDGLEAELRSLTRWQELGLEGRQANDLRRSVARRSPGPPRPGQGQSRRLHRGERRRSRSAAP